MSQNSGIKKLLKKRNNKSELLLRTPNSWMKCFDITKPEDVAAINQEIIEKVRAKELAAGEKRKLENKAVMGIIKLEKQPLLKPHIPKKKERRIFIYTADNELRMRYIERMKEFTAACRECYQRWRAGELNVAWPPGAFRPANFVLVNFVLVQGNYWQIPPINSCMTEELISNLNLVIVVIRGKKVMLSSHLSGLYGVDTKVLLQAVKRNIERFPEDFMFQITAAELESLRSQSVTLKDGGRGKHSKYLPYAFTQEGIAMLSSVLRSPRAIQANIAIMRTFVKLREMMLSHQELSRKIEALERKYDSQFKVVFKSIKELIDAKPKDLLHVLPKKKIGFGRD